MTISSRSWCGGLLCSGCRSVHRSWRISIHSVGVRIATLRSQVAVAPYHHTRSLSFPCSNLLSPPLLSFPCASHFAARCCDLSEQNLLCCSRSFTTTRRARVRHWLDEAVRASLSPKKKSHAGLLRTKCPNADRIVTWSGVGLSTSASTSGLHHAPTLHRVEDPSLPLKRRSHHISEDSTQLDLHKMAVCSQILLFAKVHGLRSVSCAIIRQHSNLFG